MEELKGIVFSFNFEEASSKILLGMPLDAFVNVLEWYLTKEFVDRDDLTPEQFETLKKAGIAVDPSTEEKEKVDVAMQLPFYDDEEVNLHAYLMRVIEELDVAPTMIFITLLYLKRWCNVFGKRCVCPETVQNLFGSALSLAYRYLEDWHKSPDFHTVFRQPQINFYLMEVSFSLSLRYDVFVDEDAYLEVRDDFFRGLPLEMLNQVKVDDDCLTEQRAQSLRTVLEEAKKAASSTNPEEAEKKEAKQEAKQEPEVEPGPLEMELVD